MKILLLIFLGKLLTGISKFFKLGAGSTWPGHLAILTESNILPQLTSKLNKGVILVAGTNGKTTTSKMIDEILEFKGEKIIKNEAGANLLNGMVSALINQADWLGKITADWAIFETDEATLPLVLSKVTPKIIILLNLFRDQLDRYGEVDLIAGKWREALIKLPETTTVILNADDPHIAQLGKNLAAKVIYFGLEDEKLFLAKAEHAVDSIYCPNCGEKLLFDGFFFSHLGHWQCLNCQAKRPKPDLSYWPNGSNLKGVYNQYNTLAAVLAAKTLRVKDSDIASGLANFKPAFGRQEELKVDGKKARIILSKNPAGFNESLRVLKEFPGAKKTVLLVLNDRIPDGRDVSWIWDVDFENMADYAQNLILSGDRVDDLALRIKYADFSQEKTLLSADLAKAIKDGLKEIKRGETLYILPTYSAMLEVRKIIAGRKLI